MSVGVVMTIHVFTIQRHGLANSARTAVLFGLVTNIIVSLNYLFFWSGASGWPAKLLIPKSADFEIVTIEDILTFVGAAVSCHAMIVERSYGGKR